MLGVWSQAEDERSCCIFILGLRRQRSVAASPSDMHIGLGLAIHQYALQST